MPISDATLPPDDPNALRTDWRASATSDTQKLELFPVPGEHDLHFAVSQGEPGATIEIDAVTRCPEEPLEDIWKVRSMLRLSEIDAARLGVILTYFADAEDCIAFREELLRGPIGAKILARSIRRQVEKNATRPLGDDLAPAEPSDCADDHNTVSGSTTTFTLDAGRLTTAVGPIGASKERP